METQHTDSKTLYRGKIVDLVVDQVRSPSGEAGIREVVRHPGGAVIVPLLPDGTVVLVRQHRYPLGKEILELPAGKLEPAEDPRVAAGRELEEETGYRAGELTLLTSIYTSPGFCDEELSIYLATGLSPSPDGARREEGESSMITVRLPLSEAITMIEGGAIRDGKTIVGLLLAVKRLEEEGSGR